MASLVRDKCLLQEYLLYTNITEDERVVRVCQKVNILTEYNKIVTMARIRLNKRRE